MREDDLTGQGLPYDDVDEDGFDQEIYERLHAALDSAGPSEEAQDRMLANLLAAQRARDAARPEAVETVELNSHIDKVGMTDQPVAEVLSVLEGGKRKGPRRLRTLGLAVAASVVLAVLGVSVASRITTVRQHSDIGLEDFKAHVRRTLCDGEIELDEHDIVEIEQIMQTYLTPEFILGNNPRCNLVKQGRIEGVGELQVSLELNRNRITAINLAGDYFLVGDLDDGLLNKLHGVQFTHQALTDALDKVEVRQIILNLSTNQFINFLTD